MTYFFFAPLFIPFFILGVPLVDMAFAFVRRTARGQSFHTPDKEHIHHRLLRLGHGPRRSVIILWAWTAILSSFLLFPLFVHQVNAFIPIGAAALGRGPLHLLPPRAAPGRTAEDGGGPSLDAGKCRRRRGAPERVRARWSGSPSVTVWTAIRAGMR